MPKLLTVVIKEPDQPARIDRIDASLANLQALVGGYIESVRLGDTQFIVNEEGRLRNLQPNFISQHVGTIRGTAIILPSRSTPGGNFVSFTPAQAEAAVVRFSNVPTGPLPVFM